MFEYRTEPVSITEKVVGRTTAGNVGAAAKIGRRFTELAADGWEFVQMAPVPVIGSARKSKERRVLTIAVFRRSVSSKQ